MQKQKKPSKTTHRNAKIKLRNDTSKMPEIPEYQVFEAQIDRERDISPKNDKA